MSLNQEKNQSTQTEPYAKEMIKLQRLRTAVRDVINGSRIHKAEKHIKMMKKNGR